MDEIRRLKWEDKTGMGKRETRNETWGGKIKTKGHLMGYIET